MRNLFPLAVLSLFAALIVTCGNQLAGNGSEITNGNCAIASVPADSAMVVAYPNKYVPCSTAVGPETTFTDTKGNFAIYLGHDAWNLVIYDRTKAFGAFVPLPSGDSAISTIILRGLGSISGVVNDTATDPRYVGIVGSPFCAGITGVSDTFSLTKIPAYSYYVKVWRVVSQKVVRGGDSLSNEFTSNINPSLIAVEPDSTTTVNINP
jgi:hypothetical protein